MRDFITDYNVRLAEIDAYFDFLEFIDKVETYKQHKITVGTEQYALKREMQKILRSNSFLLLYNLIESSIRNGILAVYDQIHDDGLTYDDVSSKIKDIWLAHKVKDVQASTQKVSAWLKDVVDELFELNTITLQKDSINISGNLDFNNIQKIVHTYGFFGPFTIDKVDVKVALDKIKRERNLLAHGNKSFSQSGEIITMQELAKIKNEATKYIRELLDNIETYIREQRYRKIRKES